MYEDYLEDYVYKLMAKLASRICKTFTRTKKPPESEHRLVPKMTFNENINESVSQSKDHGDRFGNEAIDDELNSYESQKASELSKLKLNELVQCEQKDNEEQKQSKSVDNGKEDDINEDLNNINFHMMMFFLWLSVALVNVPALLTWARNFK